jgi:Protein of unknown function (DUF1490)
MHPGALFTGSLGRRLVEYTLAGVAGNLIVQGGAKLVPRAKPAARRLAVGTIAQTIVAGRRLNEAAEEARLRAGDMMAEARASLGEQTPATGRSESAHAHDHGHEH